MQPSQNPLLRLRPEIDQRIATHDQIHLCERGIDQQIVAGKYDALPQLVLHDKLVAALGEKPFELLRSHLGGDRFGICPGRGCFNIDLLDIGGEYLERGPAPGLIKRLQKGHGD